MTTLLPRAICFTLGVLTAAAMLTGLATAAEPEPKKLTSLQMDIVTAGLVAMTVTATAVAVGNPIHVSTEASTSTKSLPNGVVEMGRARGKAYACCGPYTDADVWTDSYADGVIVAGHRTNKEMSNPKFSKAFGKEFIVSVNPPGLVGKDNLPPGLVGR